MGTIGVLALQGAFARHAEVLASLGHRAVFVRSVGDLAAIDGLVLPGGESTVQLEMIARLGLEAPLRGVVERGVPVLATCAGLVLAARSVTGPVQRSFGFIDVAVARNAFGPQVESFEAVSEAGRACVFIRAPRITEAGAGVSVLDRLGQEPILVRQGNVVCATFHPELTGDAGVHRSVFGEGESSRARAERRGHA